MSEGKNNLKRAYIDINPDILAWARERARYTQSQLAKKLGVSADRYRLFEAGEAKPTIRQVTRLVSILNQSLQVFFLDHVPDEPEPLAEMRRLPGSIVGEESPELAEQVHIAIERRETALQLFRDLGESPQTLMLGADPHDDPEHVGERIRDSLGVDLEEQTSWSDEYEALREWRSALEDAGVLVFQVPRVSIDEMRGFSLALDPLPIIGFNSKDWPRGRVFTIFHELSHVLLRDTILDSTGRDWFQLDLDYETEWFCNAVAAAALVPREDIRAQAEIIGKNRKALWQDFEIAELSARYHVSRAVVVRRLDSLDLISQRSFQDLRDQYGGAPKRKTAAGGDFYRNKLAHMGTLIPRLAFRAYYENQATTSELSMFLGMKAKNLGRFEERVFGSEYAFRSE